MVGNGHFLVGEGGDKVGKQKKLFGQQAQVPASTCTETVKLVG
jgi:hypothetical protein